MVSTTKNQQDSESKSKLIERREEKDRRSFNPSPQFPITDSDGNLIKKDRRNQPDRRIGNIEVSYSLFNKD